MVPPFLSAVALNLFIPFICDPYNSRKPYNILDFCIDAFVYKVAT